MRALAWVLARLPLRLAAALCALLAGVWWGLLPVRRRLAVDNLRRAFPEERPGPALRRLVGELTLGYVELLHHHRRELDAVVLEGFEPLLARARAGQGSLVLAGHGGSWDLCGLLTAQQTGIPTSVIAKEPAHPGVAALVREVREAGGLELLPVRGAMPRVLAALAEGRVVIFFLDQRHNAGVPLPFLGRPAWTSTALARVAAQAGVPVFGVWQWREGVARHRVRAWPPFALSGEVEADTRRFLAFYEDRISERPYAWLWLHDRWRRP